MTNNNNLITENKKPFETVYELKDEYKTPSFEEFMKDYKADGRINDSYELEVDSYGNIRERKSCGPMYRASNDSFSIRYRFNHSPPNRKNYFEQSGIYSNELRISGSIWNIKEEQWKFEDGKIKVVVNEGGSYKRNLRKEEEVKDQLRRDIRKFELWRCGNPGNIEREFEDIVYIASSEVETQIYACPQKSPQKVFNKK